jgi:hypothetical protein
MMALCNSDIGEDIITLSALFRNSALSGYAKGVISSANFMNIVASIKMKQDAVTLAEMDVCADLNTLPADEKEKLYATFPKTPAAFSNVLAYWLLQLGEMNQANFAGENIDEPNSFYKKIIQNNRLVVFSTISYNHAFVYRGGNRWNKRLHDTRNGCNLVSKCYYFLTSAVKRFVLIHLSALCCTGNTDQGFLDSHMNPRNFRNRMEAAREILLDYLLSEGDPQLVTELRRFQHHLDQISESAAAASAASSVAAPQADSPGSSQCCHLLLTATPTCNASKSLLVSKFSFLRAGGTAGRRRRLTRARASPRARAAARPRARGPGRAQRDGLPAPPASSPASVLCHFSSPPLTDADPCADGALAADRPAYTDSGQYPLTRPSLPTPDPHLKAARDP